MIKLFWKCEKCRAMKLKNFVKIVTVQVIQIFCHVLLHHKILQPIRFQYAT